MEKILTPTAARKNLYKIISNVNRDSKPVIIQGTDKSKSAVLIAKKDYDSLQETMKLILNGQIRDAKNRENDESVDLDQMIQDLENE
ncbi:type II toxin-antitoxin system Phd/YefM family antitoxin [Xylocopilactobacillus apis]|uniref:type II toxin-antitoxin system Phd/YefM family antitoxin n=1 Tax=Xylocopilactobacillus apis TaxID=2932183 RepID=UPI00295509AA|nr:type II toxin-antitoxin system Phd/YefM family antitoxin [Xylocopilactobacillus apis]